VRIVVPERFNGPPGSANGGWVSGLLAGCLDAPVVQVRLLAPPPLRTPMEVVLAAGDAEARVEGAALLRATPAEVIAAAPAPVPFGTALAAQEAFPGRDAHPFPTCFVCGPDRAPGDGLRLAPGPAPGLGVSATTWVPDSSLGGDPVPAHACWAALDCPGGWAVILPGRPLVLGTMTARLVRRPRVGEPCVVVGVGLEQDGRKHRTASALYGADAEPLGHADAVWIAI
jgi:hypothetical protein